ncbi:MULTISPECIES: hypothetical protein [unclassified Neochlamydia]|nr:MULTISPECIES: hypothetical protein [unclassified Neochlamydia]MBS4165537.1 hypothetical protein [Neochlamydia sp. AcF65]MBS4169626.1 hypothetical protein [Neochlamydia sp. AcF95]
MYKYFLLYNDSFTARCQALKMFINPVRKGPFITAITLIQLAYMQGIWP